MKKVRTAVVGVGSLGQHHARIYSALESCELVAVCDVDQARAASLADTYGCGVVSDIQELPGKVDAVSVVVPTDLHRDVAGYLLQQGIHCLVEKPIAATSKEAEEMVELAKAHEAILQVGHIERFNPVLGFLEQRRQQPKFIEAHRLAPYPPPREGLHPRGTEVSVVLDLMIHDLEILLHLVGSDVKQIHAVGVPVLSPTEDIANVRLLFENDCVANVTASRISPEKMRKIRVFFEDSYLSLDYQAQAGELYSKADGQIIRQEIPIEKDEPLALELKAFADCVARRDEPVVSGEHAARALQLAVEILQSIERGVS